MDRNFWKNFILKGIFIFCLHVTLHLFFEIYLLYSTEVDFLIPLNVIFENDLELEQRLHWQLPFFLP